MKFIHIMFISVIIATCDRPQELTLCLQALGHQPVPDGLGFEVIVVDDSRSCSALPVVWLQPWHNMRWVKGHELGPAVNRNHGASYANGDWFAFIDDDTIPDANYLECLAASIISYPYEAILEGCAYPGRSRSRRDGDTTSDSSRGQLWCGNLLIRRHVFVKLGGFSEEIAETAMASTHLRLKIRQAGLPVRFAAQMRVWQPWRQRDGWAVKRKLNRAFDRLAARCARFDSRSSRHVYGMLFEIRSLIRHRFRSTSAYFEDQLLRMLYLFRQ